MNKLLLILSITICTIANAQYTKLFDFAGATNGGIPNGDLISDGTFLYGMTSQGGANGDGMVFRIKPDGTGDTILLNFSGVVNGSNPNGSLIFDGSFLYGMTAYGGAGNNNGVIFKMKTNGTGYVKLHDFTGAPNLDGSGPFGSLITDGTYLFGMTQYGGVNNNGVIFKIKNDGTGYIDLLDFSGVNGESPYGSLIYDGTFLYGMTTYGGTNTEGAIFKIKPDGTWYTKLLDFPPNPGAGRPYGSLISDGNYLYGMTTIGNGVIFKIKPDGSGYLEIFNFSTSSGNQPCGSLIYDGTFLYGMTKSGGANGNGIIFKIKPDGTDFINLQNFSGTLNGSTPIGSLLFFGGSLYGMTSAGGANNDGVIFKYYNINVNATMVGNPVCSNQCVGSANTSVSGGTPPYTYFWSTSPMLTTATATGLCSGTTYTVTVADSIGSSTDTVTIAALPPPTTPQICAITVDSLSQYNNIFWDKTSYINSSTDSFIVYRYDVISTHYLRIGAVSINSLSMFTDTVFSIGGPNGGDPKYSSWKYRLSVRDTCGNISIQSLCVKSIFIQANGANFSWTAYVDSANANLPTGYSFKRDDNNTGNWHVLANVASTSTTDPNYASYPNGNWRVDALGLNCTATVTPKNPYTNAISLNSSRSNTYRVGTGGIHEIINAINIFVAPNPSNGIFQIQINNTQLSIEYYQLAIYNVLGECIYQHIGKSPNQQIDLSEAPNGIYFLQLKTSEGVAVKKLVISR